MQITVAMRRIGLLNRRIAGTGLPEFGREKKRRITHLSNEKSHKNNTSAKFPKTCKATISHGAWH
jgi:hypothetical protein